MSDTLSFQGGTLVISQRPQSDPPGAPFQWIKGKWRCEGYHYSSLPHLDLRDTVPCWQRTAADLIALCLAHAAAWLDPLRGDADDSCVDFDLEMMESMQPLSWDVDDIAFACEIIEEAEAIMADVHAGLEWINQNPAASEVLQHNVRRIYKAMNRQKGKRDEPRVKLKWP